MRLKICDITRRWFAIELSAISCFVFSLHFCVEFSQKEMTTLLYSFEFLLILYVQIAINTKSFFGIYHIDNLYTHHSCLFCVITTHTCIDYKAVYIAVAYISVTYIYQS